jgi:hypothetical protein
LVVNNYCIVFIEINPSIIMPDAMIMGIS